MKSRAKDQAAWKKRQREKGFVPVSLWVHKLDKVTLVYIAQLLRERRKLNKCQD